jgi:hypothetical protein
MNQHPQLSTGQAAGCRLHALEQLPRDEARNAVTANVIESWIDEADRLYTAAPAAALGLEIVGRASKTPGSWIRSFFKTIPRIKCGRMMWANS